MSSDFIIKNEYHNKTAEAFLRRELGLSRRQIASLKFRPGGLKLNGERCRTSAVLKEGDRLEIRLERGDSAKLLAGSEGPDLDILYEDENTLAVNKPGGMVFHPAHGHYTDSLANRVAAHAAAKGENWTVRPAGRLDKDTSGIAVFAKSAEAAALLARPGAVRKTYHALVEGVPDPPEGCVDQPIAQDPRVLGKMCISADGKPAQTYYETMAVMEDTAASAPENSVSAMPEQPDSQELSLLSVRIVHGRTHQIRLHLSSVGHPLLGDPLYGNGEKNRTRAMLHCRSAEIILPFSNKRILVEAPFPEDWRSFISL